MFVYSQLSSCVSALLLLQWRTNSAQAIRRLKRKNLSYIIITIWCIAFFFWSEKSIGWGLFFRWSVLFQLMIWAHLLQSRWKCVLGRNCTFPWSDSQATPPAPGSEEQIPSPWRKSLSLQNGHLFAVTPVSFSPSAGWLHFQQKRESADGAAASLGGRLRGVRPEVWNRCAAPAFSVCDAQGCETWETVSDRHKHVSLTR